MKKVTLAIISVAITADGGMIIRTKPTEENESGRYAFKPAMADSLIRNAGCANAQQFKLMCEGATYTCEYQAVKAGEAWVNKKTGETGTYTKDWMKPANQEITLAPQKAMQLTVLVASNSINLDSLFSVGSTPVAKGESFNAAPVTAEEPANTVVAEETITEETITEEKAPI